MEKKVFLRSSYKISLKSRLTQILFLVSIYFDPSICTEFNRNYTGVVYGAYIKHREYGEIPEWKTYTWTHIKTMLEVISEEFSQIATYGVGANPNTTYERYVSYYDSNKQAYAAEAAAAINKERNTTALTIFVGIYEEDTLNQTDTEARVALGSATKANEIYPGTALGLIFTQTDIATNVKRASLTLEAIKMYKEEAKSSGLKIGSRQTCSHILTNHTKNATSDILEDIQRNIVAESDFIICERRPEISNYSDPETSFLKVKADLIEIRGKMLKINPNIQVMGQTGWPSKGSYPSQNMENLEKYWKLVNEFAVKYEFKMWMFEAFDCPWKDWDTSAPYFGWWKLTNNSKIHLREGYKEKLLGGTSEEQDPGEAFPVEVISKTKNPWIYVAVINGALIVVIFVIMTTLYSFRVNKMKRRLTKSDLEEFMRGIPRDPKDKETALNFPYDTSLEILIDSLIKYELLGSGQYGSVYRATFENSAGEVIEVALKVPNDDCPKYVLKGFLSEIKILTYLGKHENLVPIRGAYTQEILKGVVYIATEYCCMGSLQKYLRKCRANNSYSNYGYEFPAMLDELCEIDGEPTTSEDTPEVHFMDMVRWSYQISCGMEYLGNSNIVHNDLALRNVVLTSNKNAKITDFGLSRRLYEYTTYIKTNQEPLPWRWMSIESLKRLEFSSKSDVWSFGVCLYELFSLGDIPYPGLSWSPDFADSLEQGMRMKNPPFATPEIFSMMSNCWLNEPNSRPTFTNLKESISRIFDACDSTYTVFH